MRDGLEADLSNFSLGQPESIRGKAHAHRMNLLVPLFVSFKLQNEKRTDTQLRSLHTQKKTNNNQGKKGRPKCNNQTDSSEQVMHLIHSQRDRLVVTKLVIKKRRSCNSCGQLTVKERAQKTGLKI